MTRRLLILAVFLLLGAVANVAVAWGCALLPIRGVRLPAAVWGPDASYALPFRPIWTAFAINTLFYAATLWLLIRGPFGVRRFLRFLRLERGLCPKCVYPMGESSVSTECGRALPSSA